MGHLNRSFRLHCSNGSVNPGLNGVETTHVLTETPHDTLLPLPLLVTRLDLLAGLLYKRHTDGVHYPPEPVLLRSRVVREVLPEGRERIPEENADNCEEVYLDAAHGVEDFDDLAWHVAEGAEVIRETSKADYVEPAEPVSNQPLNVIDDENVRNIVHPRKGCQGEHSQGRPYRDRKSSSSPLLYIDQR